MRININAFNSERTGWFHFREDRAAPAKSLPGQLHGCFFRLDTLAPNLLE
jgi:hypothetical protein